MKQFHSLITGIILITALSACQKEIMYPTAPGWPEKPGFPQEAPAQAPKDDGIQTIGLFGSSTIAQWPDSSFKGYNIVKRGFGGKTFAQLTVMADTVFAGVEDIDQLFIYSGDNDVDRGSNARQIYDAEVALYNKLRKRFPEAEIHWMAIKHSPKFWATKYNTIETANLHFAKYLRGGNIYGRLESRKSMSFFHDINLTLLLWNPKRVDEAKYNSDGLHLNQKKGWVALNRFIKPHWRK